MSTSLVSTVLEIEREAEAVLHKAEQEAEQILSNAHQERSAASKRHEEGVQKDLAQIEASARAEREKKIKELAVSGDAALAAVRNVSDAAFDGGVRFVMKALAGK